MIDQQKWIDELYSWPEKRPNAIVLLFTLPNGGNVWVVDVASNEPIARIPLETWRSMNEEIDRLLGC